MILPGKAPKCKGRETAGGAASNGLSILVKAAKMAAVVGTLMPEARRVVCSYLHGARWLKCAGLGVGM